MSKIVLMTDSACDITVENEQKYGIKVLCFRHAFGDQSYTSRVDFDNDKYYQMLDAFDGVPSTSQITPFQFQEYYEEEYKNGCTDLIYVSINGKGSATNGNAIMAKELFYEEYPEARDVMNIYVVDSGLYTGTYGFGVIEAAKLRDQGAAAEELVAFLEDWCAHYEVYFCMYTLKYAAKSGRINGAAAFLGNALGIKPLMHVQHGSIDDCAKVRGGDKNIAKAVMDHVMKAMEPGTPYYIAYGSDRTLIPMMENAMIDKVGYPAADYNQIGAEVAANTGPKALGVIFRRKDK